jgi:4-amino-4-deoxy-L-arabinose transferase-like glycosyltransferase
MMIKQIKTFFSLHIRWLIFLLLFSFILNLWGIHWGLPDYRGWAPDEVTPSYILNALQHRFIHGWHELYPPLHFYILAILYAPVYLLDLLNLLDFHSYACYVLFFFLGRFISVLMGTGIVLVIYLSALEFFGRCTALMTASFMALNPSFVYYAKITNMDVPYLFWFSISLLFYIRILKKHRLQDYILFTVMAVFAVCTKDQAYGLYLLSPLPILISLIHEYRSTRTLTWRHLITDKRILLSLLTGIILFLLIHNVILNPEGFINHIKRITGPGVVTFREYPNTLTGQMHMFLKAIRHMLFLMGWPLFVLCCIGLILVVIRKDRPTALAPLFIMIFSYYITFIMPIGYHYVRFFLPLCLVFGFYGGNALEFIFNRFRPSYGFTLFLLSIFIPLLMVIAVNLSMTFDSRIHVENWLIRHIRSGETTAFIGWKEYLPRKGDLEGKYIRDATVGSLEAFSPDYIVINERTCKCDGVEQALLDGSLNYRPFYRYHKNPWPVSWLLNQIYRDGEKQISTNLDKINPSIAVFKRIENEAEHRKNTK